MNEASSSASTNSSTKPNTDQGEIEKFNQLASRWWDPNSEFKPLHDINPLRLGYIEKHGGPLKDKKVLDVGCGGGILSESMAQSGAEVMAIDMAEAGLAVAKLHLLESQVQVDYQQRTVESLSPEFDGQFDVVTCMEMLEHVPSPSSVIASCARLVKPGGHVFFSTINRNPKAFLMAIVGAEYILKLLPKGTHEYNKLIRPAELGAWARAADLEVCDLIGMHYNPIAKSYKLAPGVDVNYLVHTQRMAD